MKYVDAWIQHPNLPFLQHEMFESLRRWPTYWSQLSHRADPIPVISTIDALDEAGIDIGLASAWTGPEGVLISNDEVSNQVNSYPERLRGILTVDIRKPVEAITTVRHFIRNHGFVAVRVLPWLWNLPPNNRLFYPVYAACVELDVPFCTQVGHTGPLYPSEPGRPIPYLDDVARDFPDLRIVAGHIGYPWQDEMIALSMKYPNVFIDTSAYKITRYPKSIIDYIKDSGMKKVIFGSNFPMLRPKECLTGLDMMNFTEETKLAFLGKNAARVFKLGN